MTDGSAVKTHRKWRPPDGYIPARPRHVAEGPTPKAEAEHGSPSDGSAPGFAMDHLSYLDQLSAARFARWPTAPAAAPKRHGVHAAPLSADSKEERDRPPAHGSPASITASSDASPTTGDARPTSRPQPAKAVHKLSAVCQQVVGRYDPLRGSARAYVCVCAYVGPWAYPTLCPGTGVGAGPDVGTSGHL